MLSLATELYCERDKIAEHDSQGRSADLTGTEILHLAGREPGRATGKRKRQEERHEDLKRQRWKFLLHFQIKHPVCSETYDVRSRECRSSI